MEFIDLQAIASGGSAKRVPTLASQWKPDSLALWESQTSQTSPAQASMGFARTPKTPWQRPEPGEPLFADSGRLSVIVQTVSVSSTS
jgi:hypothetical protein